jgi:pimeloyl-ACP methyl ester carboxylesterase
MTGQPAGPTRLLDLGGTGPIVHLAHANGFPPGTYRPLAEILTGQPVDGSGRSYHVIALPSRPLWPGSLPDSAPSWHPLADDLIRGLDDLGLSGIVGVGHSLGGVLTLWAAVRRPDLFRAVVLVDPVILSPAMLWVLGLLRRLGLERRLPLVRRTLRRRRAWSSRQDCYAHFRRKSLFATWPDASLWAYVEAGTHEGADGQVQLVYPPEWEARIFATTPIDVWRAVPHLSTPALVVRGERSETFRSRSEALMARLVPQARFVVVPGAGHLVPMERPAETGAAIRQFLDDLPLAAR